MRRCRFRFPSVVGLAVVAGIGAIVGCGAINPAYDAAREGVYRVRLARLALPDAPATLDARVNRFASLSASASGDEAFAAAGDIESHWAAELQRAGDLQGARSHFQQALEFDKLAHYRRRGPGDAAGATPDLAVTLMNLSVVHEELGDVASAVRYGERAYAINAGLNLVGRQRRDLERLARLYRALGDSTRAEEAERARAGLALLRTGPGREEDATTTANESE